MVQMNRFAGQKWRHRCREQTYGHQGSKAAEWGGGAVMNWEIGIDIYTLICIKWITNKNLLYKKINKIFKKLIYFWPHWVFVALRGLSLVVVSGGYSSLRCTGFSLRWLLLLQSMGFRAHGLQ